MGAVPKLRTKASHPYGISDKEGVALVTSAKVNTDKHGFTSTAPRFDDKPQPRKGK